MNAPERVAPGDWRAIDFISDLHLSESTPNTFDAWSAHLASTPADCVFMLGDLFEAWIGDDLVQRPFEARCADVLRRASSRLVIGFMAGNRDFLLGDGLLDTLGVERLADPTVIHAFGVRVLVSHGDWLCLGDVAYQRFRSIVRRPSLQRAFLAMPLAWRQSAARALRGRGRGRGGDGDERPPTTAMAAIDVDRAAALVLARDADASVFIHGHTHAPAVHELAPGIARFVLSDWDLDHAARPRAEVLRWDRSGLTRIAPVSAGQRPGAD